LEGSLSDQPRQAFVVSHTHWDREWYLTFNRFRVNLVQTVGKVLDALEHDPEFKHFVLDGQTAVLEDYLEAMPGDRDRVRRLMTRGDLAVGPWYILPDEFLVSGEATARNLLYGRKAARSLGPVQRVGYMPDSFGHVAQIPQILRLAGIDSFVFTRGLGSEADSLGWLFSWLAPDGSDVLAVNQCDGYCNAGGLGLGELWHAHTRRAIQPELAVAKVGALLEKMSARPGADPVLLNNGCDHFPPQKELGAVLAALLEAFPDTTFTHARFADFIEAARAGVPDRERPEFRGELLGGRDHLILSGVWSTRMYLKQQNEICQNLLCRVVEPLCAMHTFLHGGVWPGGLLDLAWKELLRNHPHDSICGCSTDSVHKDMETRFAAVIQTGEQITARLMDEISPMFGPHQDDDANAVITVANPLPVVRNEVVERLVVLPSGSRNLDRLRLVDETGHPVPFRILDRRFLERFWGIDYRGELYCEDQLDLLDTYLHRFGHRIIGGPEDGQSHDCFLLVQFLAENLPAVGVRNYLLVDQAAASGTPPTVFRPVGARLEQGRAILENKNLRVELHPDGTFDLKDLTCGREFHGLNLLEDTEDAGDEYDYCPAETGLSIFAGGSEGKVKITDSSDLLVGAEAVFRLDLPRGLEKDRRKRQQRMTNCDVTVRLTLRAGDDRVDVETAFHNRAYDHRLRAWFPTGIDTDEVLSDGHFMVNRRPLQRQGGSDWTQPAPLTWPQQDWSALQDSGGGLAIFNRGLPEFQAWRDGDRGAVFALTLLRCVDWLSRDDLATRNNLNAGPTLHTPDAQCLGRQVFRYAVAPYSGQALEAGLVARSEKYRVPPVTHQGVTAGLVPGGASLVAKTDPRVAITAIKRAERAPFLCVRLVNLSQEKISEVLEFGVPVRDAEKSNLLETSLHIERDPVFVSDGGTRIKVPLLPHEIATVIIELEEPLTMELKP
jgi:mannosylglycerate hydrolase